MKSKIWLSSPHMGFNELKYVNEAFETNWIAPLGPHVNAFENGLQAQTQTKYAAALSSGTSAIHLALILLGVKAGDTVFCQSITFSASANPIAYQGAIPVFIDSENETWKFSVTEKSVTSPRFVGLQEHKESINSFIFLSQIHPFIR